MNLRPDIRLAVMGTALAFALNGTAWAGPPPAPWTTQNIGEPAAAGSIDVNGSDVWTVNGSGVDIDNNADSFYFAYQPVGGDASLTARLLNSQGGDGEWSKAGLMIRENDTAGSPTFCYAMTPGHGLTAQMRPAQDEAHSYIPEVGPASSGQKNLYLRLQRAGHEIAGFYSSDGQVWTQADFSPQPLPTLQQAALLGLAVTSHQDGKLTTATFDQVSLQQGATSVYGLQASGGEGSVQLQWRPLPEAVGFNLYRGPAGATVAQLSKLNDQPVAGASFTDRSEGLVSDTPVSYAVAAVFKGAGGEPVQGPLVAVLATPVTLQPGWTGSSINVNREPGAAAFDPASGEITLRASGGDIWFLSDQFYFLSQPVDGVTQITVKALTPPSGADPDANAGLMIRESLDGSAPHALIALTANRALLFKYRATAHGNADGPSEWAIKPGSVKTPITLRLTRQGRTITPEYSIDDGQTFQSAGEPLTFDHDLPGTLYVGLALTSHQRSQISQAKFKDVTIR
jgi:regulation of enolase protein 1 (concanavalin A-like superfamily)